MRYVNYTLYILWVTVALLYAQPADAIRRNPNTAAAIHLAQQKNIGLQSITKMQLAPMLVSWLTT